MSATMKAAVHHGKDYEENLRTTKNTDFDKILLLFDITRKLIFEQKRDIYGISTIDWDTIVLCCMTMFSSSRQQKFSDSVLVSEAELLSILKSWSVLE